jgi:hypothetical protein
VNATGTIDWSTHAGGAGFYSVATAAVSDGLRGLLLSGTYVGRIVLGSTVLTCADNHRCVFVAGMGAAAEGEWAIQWASKASGDSLLAALDLSGLVERTTGILSDGDGGAIISGVFTGTATFGESITLTSHPSAPCVVSQRFL